MSVDSGPSARRLGAQLWLESDASSATVDSLVARASEAGLGLLRVFLVWPWIEPQPAAWDFRVFDEAFAAAERHGLRIKATLTPNSGPWHVGTPSALHSHTLILDPGQGAAIERYIERCVRRYAPHPCLEQWVIWNEPFNLAGGADVDTTRSDDERVAWVRLLERRYDGDVAALNRRWRTGYTDFSEAAFPEEIPHPRHRKIAWLSYGPWLDEYHHRCAWLRSQLGWVADLVRGHDSHTPICANPSWLFNNHAVAGYDFPALASVLDVVGASFHPPWSFEFVPPGRYAAVMAAATSFLGCIPGVHRVEVTETQLGNVNYASPNPSHITPSEVATYYLAPLFAGAESVTGWSLNTRRHDFEAGEWGLLDDDDRPSERSRVLRRVAQCLEDLEASIGAWSALPPRALVLCSSDSQAVEMLDSRVNSAWDTTEIPGRRRDDAVQGMFTLAATMLAGGVPTAACPIEAISEPSQSPERLIVASHIVAYSEEEGRRLLELTEQGATLLIDGTSGQKTPDASLHRPWPGLLSQQLGFRSRGLTTRRDGFPVTIHGATVGHLVLALSDLEFSDSAWSAWSDTRVGNDAAPLIWERPVGHGKVIVFAGALGPSLVADPGLEALVRHVLVTATPRLIDDVRPLTNDAFALRVVGRRGDGVGVFGAHRTRRGGHPLRVELPPGRYRDLWNGDVLDVTHLGESPIEAPDGLAVLVAAPGA